MNADTLNALMNTSLVADPKLSYIFVSAWRAVAIMLLATAVWRTVQVLLALPRRHASQTLRDYFNTPWWRTPAAFIVAGLIGFLILIGLQIPAAGANLQRPLAQFTGYNLLGHGMMMLVAWGVLSGSGHLLRQAHPESA